MTNVKRVFVDTSYWIALIERGEKSHRQVAKSFITLQKNGTQFFTNDYVLDEAWTRLITGNHFQEAKMLKERVYLAENNREITLLYTDRKLFEQAWETFVKFADLKLSFTDALIATTVRKLKIDEILTLDRGFTKAGFSVRPMLK